MAEAMGDTTSGRLERFRNQWDEIKETLGAPIIGFVSEQLERFMPLLMGAGEALSSFLEDDPLSSLGNMLPPEIRDALSGFWESLQGLAGTVTDSWPTVQEHLDSFAEWFGGMAGQEVPGIIGNLAGVLDNLSAWWDEHGDTVIALVDNIVRVAAVTGLGAVDLLTGIFQALTLPAEDSGEALGIIADTLERFADSAAGLVGMDWDSVVASWQTNWEMLQIIVTTAVGNLLDPVAGQIAAWIVAGRDLMDGLKQGVQDAAAGLLEAVLAPIRAALDGVRDLLGMDSPSKVFAQMGSYMMEGMTLGINRSAEGPVLATARAGAGSAMAWDQSRNLTMGNVNIFGGTDMQAFDDQMRDWLRRG